MFGSWTNDLENLQETFKRASPVPHVVIDGFFDEAVADQIRESIPEDTESFQFRYNNPIEKKSVIGDVARVPEVQKAFAAMERNIPLFESVSGIRGLEYDVNVHGGGVHRFTRGGKLDLHLDYSKHPETGKERRLNVIVFMSKDWDPEWGGSLELWNANCTARRKSIEPVFNRAVLFATGNTSWHGVPTPVRCPEGKTRDSVACYFVSDPTENMDPGRQKAMFVPHPTQPLPPKLLNLYSTRKTRRLEEDDLWAGWESDPVGKGFWW